MSILQGEARAHATYWQFPWMTPERRQAELAQIEPTGVKFRAVLRAVNEGGLVEASGTDLRVSKANAVTLLVVAATDYRGGDPTAACERYLARAAKPYADLRTAHVADHERLFRRVELALARPGERFLASRAFRQTSAWPGSRTDRTTRGLPRCTSSSAGTC